jgi:hypothetical protein
MSFYLFDFAEGVLFEWDCELREGSEVTVNYPDHEVESGAVVNKFGVDKPDKYNAEGLVTATPFDSVLGIDLQRVMDADAAIKKIAKDHRIVTLVSGWFVVGVVITRVTSGAGQGDPTQINIAANFKVLRLVEPATTQIPASRLKPKPRPRAAPATRGGASTSSSGASKPAAENVARSVLFTWLG